MSAYLGGIFSVSKFAGGSKCTIEYLRHAQICDLRAGIDIEED